MKTERKRQGNHVCEGPGLITSLLSVRKVRSLWLEPTE